MIANLNHGQHGGGGLLRLRQRIKTFWSEEPVGWYIGRITVSDGERLEIKYDNGDRETFLVSDEDVVYELIDEQAFVFDSRSLTDQLKDQRFDDQWYQFLGNRGGRTSSKFKLDVRPRYVDGGGITNNPLRKTERVVWALCEGQTPLAVCFDTVANDGARLRAIWTVRGAVGEALQRGWKLWFRAQTNGASSISVVVLYTAFEVKDRQINLRTTDVSTEHHGIRAMALLVELDVVDQDPISYELFPGKKLNVIRNTGLASCKVYDVIGFYFDAAALKGTSCVEIKFRCRPRH